MMNGDGVKYKLPLWKKRELGKPSNMYSFEKTVTCVGKNRDSLTAFHSLITAFETWLLHCGAVILNNLFSDLLYFFSRLSSRSPGFCLLVCYKG